MLYIQFRAARFEVSRSPALSTCSAAVACHALSHHPGGVSE